MIASKLPLFLTFITVILLKIFIIDIAEFSLVNGKLLCHAFPSNYTIVIESSFT